MAFQIKDNMYKLLLPLLIRVTDLHTFEKLFHQKLKKKETLERNKFIHFKFFFLGCLIRWLCQSQHQVHLKLLWKLELFSCDPNLRYLYIYGLYL